MLYMYKLGVFLYVYDIYIDKGGLKSSYDHVISVVDDFILTNEIQALATSMEEVHVLLGCP